MGAEFYLWAKRNDVNLDIFSYDERLYNRREAHKMEFTSFLKGDIPNLVEKLNNEYDVVIFQSYPSAKFDDDSIQAFYKEFIKKIEILKVGFMHELNKTNIDKIPYLLFIMNEMDLVLNFSEKTWFSQNLAKALPSKKVGERIKKFTMMFNFEELEYLREKYPLEAKRKAMVYCSRWTTMKGPRRVLDFEPLLTPYGIKTELKGIERSIGAKGDIFDHPNCLDMTGKEPKGNGNVPVYGPYDRQEGMEYMASNLFVCSFYRMPKDPDAYGDRMEFAQIESIAVGSIPVFDKHWGENNRTKDGRRYIDIPYSAIYSDENDLESTAKLLNEISNDIELQKKYRDTSYQIVKEEFDVNKVLPELFELIFSVGKDENKFKSEEEMIKYLIDDEFVEEFLELYHQYDSERIVVAGFRELVENNIFALIDGKKEQEIKNFKKSKRK